MYILLYILRFSILGFAIGILYLRLSLFRKMSNSLVIMIGMASTPMFISLIDYLLGLVFRGWDSWFYVAVPLVISLLYIVYNKNYRISLEARLDIWTCVWTYVMSLGKWTILDGFIAIGIMMFYYAVFNGINPIINIHEIEIDHSQVFIVILITIILIFAIIGFVVVFRKMVKDGTLERNFYLVAIIVIVGTSFIHASYMINRPDSDSDRAHYSLNARYFAEDKDSWELDNYSNEKYGSSYTDDHGPLWTMYLADAYVMTDVFGLLDSLPSVNIAIFGAYYCFCVLLFITSSYIVNSYKAGVLSLLLFHIYEHTLLMIAGSRDAFRFLAMLLLIIYVMNLIETSMQEQDLVRWYHYFMLSLFCYFSMNGHAGNVYIMLGMFIVIFIMLLVTKTRTRFLISFFISVLIGTLLGMIKNIMIFYNTGSIYNPVKNVFKGTEIEQQLQEWSQMRANPNSVLESFSVGIWFMVIIGIIGLLGMIISTYRNREMRLTLSTLVIIGILIPLTGVLNWLGYEFSKWSIVQIRYRMYPLMILSITGAWILVKVANNIGFSGKNYCKRLRINRGLYMILILVMSMFYLYAELDRFQTINKAEVNARIKDVQDYKRLAEIVLSVSHGDPFTRDQVLLYYLHGTPKLLYHPYTEQLIQAKSDEEIEKAIDDLNLGAIILPSNGVDHHNYSLLPFWKYINNEDNFLKIMPDECGVSVDRVIFYKRN